MSKKVLGRGLDALIPEQPATQREPAGAAVLELPLDRISPNPEQPRQESDPDAIAELADSIREYGVIEPVIVRRNGDAYVLVAGERRVTAARRAGLSTIPAIERDADDEDMLALALIENIQRENLNPVDEALAYRRLRDEFALTQEEVAQRVGKSRVAVANALRLLQLHPDILGDVSRGTLSAGHARAILSIEGDDARKEIWGQIKTRGLSVREAEELARKGNATGRRRRPERPAGSRDPHVAYLEDRLRQALGTQVKIHPQGAGGRIEVMYYGSADLDRLLELLGVEMDGV